MSIVDLHSIDLNLLVVLDVLLEERHVTRAAKRLGRTQSAVSHALGRLREQLDDPVLVRVGGQMRPTPRAEALGPEVRRLLQAISMVLASEGDFDAATSERTFTLAAPDFIVSSSWRLLARMHELAPGVNVVFVGLGDGRIEDVAHGRYDLAVAPPRMFTDGSVLTTPMASLSWSVFARRGHPCLDDWGLETWRRYRHIRVRTSGSDEGPVDRAVRALGITRDVGPTIPHFLLGPPLLARTDLLLTVPTGVLEDVVEAFDLVTLPCPIELAPIEMAICHGAQFDKDPAIQWFRGVVLDVLSSSFEGRA